AAGLPVGGEFQVNTQTTGYQDHGAVAAEPTGGFVVVWGGRGTGNDAGNLAVEARRFDAAGAPLGDEFQVNSYGTGGQAQPAVVADGDGFVVAWGSRSEGGGEPGRRRRAG